MAILHICLGLAGLLACVQTQAPGDGSVYCLNEQIDGVARPVYGENVWPLMDSRHYTSLLLGEDAVWQQVDVDSNNMHGIATNVCNNFYSSIVTQL